MKKVFLAVALLASTAFTQAQQAQQQPQSNQGGGALSGTQTKTIADPNEYNAYISATQQTDPSAKGAALEQFVQQYPNSVVKEDALAAAMAAYQQANNPQKSVAMAAQILQANPNNVPALAVQTYVKRSECANQPPDQQAQCLSPALEMAQRGLQQLPNYNPPGVPADAIQKQKATFSSIFNGAAGAGALAAKDFPSAQKYLTAVVEANPESIQDIYQLALAYGSQNPANDQSNLNAAFYFGRVYALLQPQASNPQVAAQLQQVARAGQYYVNKYHGKQDDSPQVWNNVVNMAKTSPAPPANFAASIPKAPSPEEQVRAKLQKNPDITQLTFEDWSDIFTYGDPQAKDTAFTQIKGRPFKFGGSKVVNATEDSVDLAMTVDGIAKNAVEARVKMTEPFKKAPEVGSSFDFQANPVSFTSNPFVMEMDNGVDLTKRATAAPKKKGKVTPKAKSKRK
jgi:hypothetical protein